MRYGSRVVGLSILICMPNLAHGAPAKQEPERSEGVTRYGPEFYSNTTPRSARDIVEHLPGFTLAQGDNALRGFEAAAGNVLIDGRRPSDKQLTIGDLLANIPVDQVDYVEVIRGGRPSVEMMGHAVVANVVRKKNGADSRVLTASVAQWRDGRTLPSAKLEITRHLNGSRTVSAAISIAQYGELAAGAGELSRTDASGALVLKSPLKSRAGGVSGFGYASLTIPLGRGQFSTHASLARSTYGHEEALSRGATGPSRLNERLGGPSGGQLKGEIGASFSTALGPKWTGEALALAALRGQSYASLFSDDISRQHFFEEEKGGEALVRAGLKYAPGERASAQFALEGAFNWLHTNSAFDFNDMAVPLPNARTRVSEARLQPSAQLEWRMAAGAKVEAGLRLERSRIASEADTRQARSLTYAKPRLIVTFTPGANGLLRGRIEREVSQLDFTHFVASSRLDTGAVQTGNTAISPQKSWLIEAGYERSFGRGGDVSITLRRSAIENAVDKQTVVGVDGSVFDTPGNIGSGALESVVVGFTLPLDQFGVRGGQIKGSGVFQRSQVRDPLTRMSRPLSYMNAKEYSIAFRQDLTNRALSWGGALTTPCATSTTAKGCEEAIFGGQQIERFSAQPALDLFVEHRPQAVLTLRLEVQNILARRYTRKVEALARPRPSDPAFLERRRLQSSPSIFVSVRRVL